MRLSVARMFSVAFLLVYCFLWQIYKDDICINYIYNIYINININI